MLGTDNIESQFSVSIAMCTYNGAHYLGEQLFSIANQTVTPRELVICDDGSTDDTIPIITAFSQAANFPVRLCSNSSRLGPTKNFEKAIGLCIGAIIVLADQDDVWEPEKLSVLIATFREHPNASYAFSNAGIIDGQGNKQSASLWSLNEFGESHFKFSGLFQLNVLLKRNVVTGAAMAFRSSLKNIVLPIPEDWLHDYWVALLGSVYSYGVPLRQQLIRYRRHESQVCGFGKKTFFQVIEHSLSTRAGETWDKLEQFKKVSMRVKSTDSTAKYCVRRVALIAQKEAHLEARSRARSSSGVSRWLVVFSEFLRGRYQRFTQSWAYSIVRDL